MKCSPLGESRTQRERREGREKGGVGGGVGRGGDGCLPSTASMMTSCMSLRTVALSFRIRGCFFLNLPICSTPTQREVCLLVGYLTSQQHASVSQGRICSDNCTRCHTEVADQTFYLTQSQYTDTGPTSPNADPITPGAWQGRHWSANFEVTGMIRPGQIPYASGIQKTDLPLSGRTP